MKKNLLLEIIFAATFLLFVMQAVNAGVSHPLPTSIELMKGESGRFKFQIQNLGKPNNIVCGASLEGVSPLKVVFDEEEMKVAADSVKYFYGTVSVPNDYTPTTTGFNPSSEQYTQKFCVECKPDSTNPGASVQIRSCDLPINVNIVEVRTTDNMYVIPKPQPKIPVAVYVGVVVLIAAITLILIKIRKKKPIKPTKIRKKKK